MLNYVAAAEHAHARVEEGRGITLGLLCDVHAALMTDSAPTHHPTSVLRDSPVVIGMMGPAHVHNARFVPYSPGPEMHDGTQHRGTWLATTIRPI